MAEVLLFHHAQGQTSGFHAFANELRRAGHTVHVPDLYEGRTFDSLDDGVAYAGEIGFGDIIERGVRAANEPFYLRSRGKPPRAHCRKVTTAVRVSRQRRKTKSLGGRNRAPRMATSAPGSRCPLPGAPRRSRSSGCQG
jgi:dienelactone hydrolase